MIDGKNSIGLDTCLLLIERGVSYGLIKHSIEKNMSAASYDLISSLCTAIEAKKMKAEDYTKCLLVKTAWKFGNEDNYFKLLPKELIDQILSYEDIDEPPYFDILFSIAKRSPEGDVTDEASEPFIKFFWRYWGTLYTSKTAIKLARNITRKDYTDEKRAAKLLYWFKRILTCPKLCQPLTNIDIDSYRTSNLTLYCMKSSNHDAVSTLEFMLQQKIITKHLLDRHHVGPAEYSFIPTVWVAVLHKNVKMIKFLIENDMLPETIGSSIMDQMSDLYLMDPTLDTIKAYISQCRQNIAQQ